MLIADEVITGLGRTGRMFGSDHWDVDPDLWICAKGLAAGYWPIAMVGMSARIASAFAERNVDFVHGHTFENHAPGCAAALAVLEQVRAPGFVDAIAAKGETLRQKVLALPDELPVKRGARARHAARDPARLPRRLLRSRRRRGDPGRRRRRRRGA